MGWPRQVLGAISAVATPWEPAEIFCRVITNQSTISPIVGKISRHLDTKRRAVS